MKWPRGRYNGRRIIGIDVQFKITVLYWKWIPYVSGFKYHGGIHWLCFRLWLNWNYE